MDGERPLQRAEANEVETFVRRAKRFFGLDPDSTDEPEALVSRIQLHIQQVRAGIAPSPSEDVVVALGALLGEQYVGAAGWQWTVRLHEEGEAHVVVDPSRAWMVMPIQWVYAAITVQDHEPDLAADFRTTVAGGRGRGTAGSWTPATR